MRDCVTRGRPGSSPKSLFSNRSLVTFPRHSADRPVLTQARLKELLRYDSETGLFVRLTSQGGKTRGVLTAGKADARGRRSFKLDRREYFAHRLAWLYVHGRWPEAGIDHKDGDPGNNRLSNLREATNSENQQNQRRAQSCSRSGFLGVYRPAPKRKWAAQITVNGKMLYLGCYSEPEAAHAAYLEAKAKHHPFQTIVDI